MNNRHGTRSIVGVQCVLLCWCWSDVQVSQLCPRPQPLQLRQRGGYVRRHRRVWGRGRRLMHWGSTTPPAVPPPTTRTARISNSYLNSLRINSIFRKIYVWSFVDWKEMVRMFIGVIVVLLKIISLSQIKIVISN